MNIEIMFDDLREEKQKELLKAYEVVTPHDMNWGVIPVTIIEATSETS
jgi:hypothetical protein